MTVRTARGTALTPYGTAHRQRVATIGRDEPAVRVSVSVPIRGPVIHPPSVTLPTLGSTIRANMRGPHVYARVGLRTAGPQHERRPWGDEATFDSHVCRTRYRGDARWLLDSPRSPGWSTRRCSGSACTARLGS